MPLMLNRRDTSHAHVTQAVSRGISPLEPLSVRFGLTPTPDQERLKAIDEVLNEVVTAHPRHPKRQLTGLGLIHRMAMRIALGDFGTWRDRVLGLSKHPHHLQYHGVSPYDIVEKFCSYGAPRGAQQKGSDVVKKLMELGVLTSQKVTVWAEKPADWFDTRTWAQSYTYEEDIPRFTPLGLTVLGKSSPWLAWMLKPDGK